LEDIMKRFVALGLALGVIAAALTTATPTVAAESLSVVRYGPFTIPAAVETTPG
jgi:hypothetical protein